MVQKQFSGLLGSRSRNQKLRIGMTQIMSVALAGMLLVFFTVSKFIQSNTIIRSEPTAKNNNGHNLQMQSSKISVPEPRSGRQSKNNELMQPEPQPDSNQSLNQTQKQNSFHFIISSDCTSYQRWETLTQLHSAQSVQQCGRFTWIVSGCLDDEDEHAGKGKGGAHSDVLTHSSLLQEVEKHFPRVTISNEEVAFHIGRDVSLAMDNSHLKESDASRDCHSIHPHVHFTPDFSDMSKYPGPFSDGKKRRSFVNRQNKTMYGNFGNIYKFNNKPNGLHHWAVDFLRKEGTDGGEAVVLVDPDFLFLNKFEFPAGNDMVAPGKPAAAKYGLGGQFLDFNLTRICERAPLPQSDSAQNKPCPFQTISNSDVHKYYSAGAPYIIHIEDVLAFSQRWVELVPPTYDEYPLLYAEMFAYSMAAADLNLKHNLIQGLFTGCMTSWPHTHGVEEHEALEISAKNYANLFENPVSGASFDPESGGAVSCFLPPLSPPPFLHYCQRYLFATPYTKDAMEDRVVHFFAKRRVDHDILDCNRKVVLEPFVEDKSTKVPHGSERNWHTLAVCATVRAINFAKSKAGCPIKTD
mmetsp:Transcript_7280/g.14612  ORF Transcript_7280/g.14612 Transcript_7280/m.14612 type:complete len:579 (-) Transcript_7280:186-1922(-)